nr:hypothetical protein GTC16762_33150 [Pigmentibacter ruber]
MEENNLIKFLEDENNQLKIEIDNLKNDKKVLLNLIEQISIKTVNQLSNLEKTLSYFRDFNNKIKAPPPSTSKAPEPNLNICNRRYAP